MEPWEINCGHNILTNYVVNAFDENDLSFPNPPYRKRREEVAARIPKFEAVPQGGALARGAPVLNSVCEATRRCG